MIKENFDGPDYRQENWNVLSKTFFMLNASVRLLLQASDRFDYDRQVAMPDDHVPNREWLEKAYDQSFVIEKVLYALRKRLPSLRN